MNDWDSQLEQLRAAAHPSVPRGADCPAAIWDEVVAGVPPPAAAESLLRHAAACPHCGPLLRRAAERAGAGVSLDDDCEAMVDALPSSRPAGRRRLARRLRQERLRQGPLRPGQLRSAALPPRRSWIYAAALAAAALAVLIVWVPGPGRALLAERLVARAYGGHRALPLRFAGADYGPLLDPRRGAPAAPSGDLLEAEGLLASGLEQRPNDSRLLRAQARADLVQGDAAAALAALLRVQALQPASPALDTDLASAYFESAEAGRDADYGSALDYLGRALAAAPRDPVALFDRAWVEEALQDWTGAIADWSDYLNLDARGPWAEEARQHLAADRKLVAGHDAAVAAPLLPPAAFVQSPQAADARIEDYLHAATVAWLPAAYPVSGPSDPAARPALAALARQLLAKHHDAWLTQMLVQAPASARNGDFPRALAALSSAVQANEAGRPDDALAAAYRAEAGFAHAASPAGRLRAAYEEVYALHRAEQGPQCMAALRNLLPSNALASNGWLEGEAALEQSNCSGMDGRPAPAAIARAAALGQADAYPSLWMRALSFAAAEVPAPDSDLSWRRQREQLALYWRESLGAYRAYQLDMMLAICSSQRRQWFAAERLAWAAVERVSLTPERSYEAMARQQLAAFAAQAGLAAEAQAQSARADALFAALPRTPATANLRAYNDLDLATIEMQAGEPAPARAALARYRREQPPVVSLDARALPYFALLGQWDFAQGNLAQAELEERAAIAIDEGDMHAYAQDEDRLGWQQRARDAYRSWIEIDWRVHRDPIAALEFWEWAKGSSVRDAHPVPPAFLAAARNFDASGAPLLPEPNLVRAILPALANQQVVSYALLPQGLAIWIFDDRGVHGVREAVSAEPLESAAHAFALACADPATDPRLLTAQSQQLYAWLLAPVAAWLDPARILVVEADGALAEIPFTALQPPGGGYLPQPVMQSPGLEYARLAHSSPRNLAASRLLAVANPALGADPTGVPYLPLPEARAEAEDAAAHFAPGSRVLAGEAATPVAVLAALSQAEVFHFAGHAEPGRLLLASTGAGAAEAFLAAPDLTPAVLQRCHLAVLAACSTAGAGLLDPDGLVRAFLRAGVPSVVATRWDVASAATNQFCAALYAALRAGDSVPRALFNAQQQLRRQPATAAPFYWAAFVAFGARS